MPLEDYEIREMEDHEKPAVLNFLLQHFCPNENLLMAHLAYIKDRINEEEERTIVEDFRRRYEGLLQKELCLVAVHRETQKIVGLNMMSVTENPKFCANGRKSPADKAPLVKSKFTSEWLASVLFSSTCTVDFFRESPTIDSTLEIDLLGVHSEHCRKGLATALIRAAVDLAKRRNIDVVYGLFTSPFSYRASKTLGFKTCREIDVMSFRDSEGNVMYDVTRPYQIFITALELQ